MAEEHKKHSEHSEHKEEHKETHHKTKIKKIVVWQSLTVILAILFVASILTGGFKGSTAQKTSAKAAAEKAVTYINANLLQQGMTATLKSVSEKNDLYVIKISIAGRDYDSYVTKDGELLIADSRAAIDMTQEVEKPDITTQPSQNIIEVSADDDPSLGPEDAKVTVIEFSDFECPYCGASAGTHEGLISQFKSQNPSWEAAVPKLKELAKEGKIRFVYRDFPLSFHPNAQKAAEAAECADEQGKFWEYHDMIFENQNALGIDSLKKYAASLKLDTSKFNSCLDSGKYNEEVKKDIADGEKAGVSGTPAFFINGRFLSGAQSFEAFKAIIDEELSGEGTKEEITNVQATPKAEPANIVATQTAPAGGCGI